MNREIKFRGINTETGEWVYGTYLDGFIINGVAEATEEYICIEDWRLVREETVGQYTGFKDKSGKEIYEGDIVQIPLYLKEYFNCEVKFNDGCFDVVEGNFADYLKVYIINGCVKIIGNIYENKELLQNYSYGAL